jgi:hypothetical protein
MPSDLEALTSRGYMTFMVLSRDYFKVSGIVLQEQCPPNSSWHTREL